MTMLTVVEHKDHSGNVTHHTQVRDDLFDGVTVCLPCKGKGAEQVLTHWCGILSVDGFQFTRYATAYCQHCRGRGYWKTPEFVNLIAEYIPPQPRGE